jgi:hypothetical protein
MTKRWRKFDKSSVKEEGSGMVVTIVVCSTSTDDYHALIIGAEDMIHLTVNA